MSNPNQDVPITVGLLRIKSLNNGRPTPQLIEAIEQNPESLVRYLNSRFKDLEAEEVTVERQPAFSIGVGAIAVEFLLGFAHGFGEVAGKAVAEAIADWIRDTYHDVEIIQLNLSGKKE